MGRWQRRGWQQGWRGFIAATSLLGALSAACSSSSGQAAPGDGGSMKPGATPTVTIADGPIKGHAEGSVVAFLGVPYAQPPVGPLRWKPPQKPAPWTDVLDAAQFGKRCAQNANPTLQTAASADEDCLYLNIWTPNPSASKLPVMVWIHGGGNTGGSASDPVPFSDGGGFFYSGASLAGNGAVVVSLNYRLGVFGFFDHPALAGEGSKSGNQGLWDQRFAMQWVQDNIAKFGGDPGNVTIFGESAGSLDVCLHVASPQTPALFERAISESGGCTTLQQTSADAQALIADFASQLGCPGSAPAGPAGGATEEGGAEGGGAEGGEAGSGEAGSGEAASEGTDALDCLRNLPVQTLLAAASQADGGLSGPFAPVVDQDFLADQPRTLYKAGKIAPAPYLLGSNNDEGTLFEIGVPAVTDQAGLSAALLQQYGDAGSAVAQLYPVSSFDGGLPNPYQAALTRVVGDSLLVCSTYDSALLAAAAGQPVYMYNFDIPVAVPGLVGSSPGELYLGASHGSELPFVFGTSPLFATDPAQAGVSALMERYWTRFASAGDPNGGTDLAWPRFSATSDQRMQFTLQPSVVAGFRSAECAFWIGVYESQFAAPVLSL